jgi:DNA-binding MarR family transcriptional regulator
MSRRQSTIHATSETTTSRPAIGPGVVQDHQRIAAVHLARRVSQILNAAVSECVPDDFLRNEFGVLVAIATTPGLEQKSIAAMMAFDATTIGQIIDQLEQRGFVRRMVSASDRRVRNVEVTEEGQRFVAKHRPLSLQAQRNVLKVLTAEERRTLLDLMARLIEAHPQFDRPGAGRRSPKSRSG